MARRVMDTDPGVLDIWARRAADAADAWMRARDEVNPELMLELDEELETSITEYRRLKNSLEGARGSGAS